MTRIIDGHFHLLATNDRPGCALSARARFGSVAGWLAGVLLETLDEELIDLIYPNGKKTLTSPLIWERLMREIAEAKEISGAVLLALDSIVDTLGRELQTDVCVSEGAVVEAIEKFRKKTGKELFVGASVHPNRTDAIDRLEHAKKKHLAVLVKWIPSSQRIDPENPRYKPYYEKLAELELPLLCHVGPESAIPDRPIDETLNNPRKLIPALNAGVTVIAAHGAAHFLPRPFEGRYESEYSPVLRQMLEQAPQRGWKLYADISACLITPYRAARVGELLEAIAEDRFVYGSDFPIFTHDLSLGRLGRKIDGEVARAAANAKNLLDKDVLSKRAEGIPESIFENTARVLNLPPTSA